MNPHESYIERSYDSFFIAKHTSWTNV